MNYSAIKEIGRKITDIHDELRTEEATKQSLVLPFLHGLGYDIFNPLEVIPEYTADYGTKTGEKVDYAIMREGETCLLIECKKASDPLDATKASQLGRYFHVCNARIGVLTNGIRYKFFSDLDSENVMDQTPFMEFDISKMEEKDFGNLKHFAKDGFDVEQACTIAGDMKYIKGMKEYLNEQYNNPDKDFASLLASQVYSGRMTQNRMAQFTRLSKVAFQNFVNERVSGMLQKASEIASDLSQDDKVSAPPSDNGQRREATTQEVEALELVKAIVKDISEPERITYKTTVAYGTVLLDGRTTYPIIRFRFAKNKKTIQIMDRMEEKWGNSRRTGPVYQIGQFEEIGNHAEAIRDNLMSYLEKSDQPGD